MKVGLIPLDERPTNTRYPQMIGQIAGIEVIMPPSEILSQYRTPADNAGLARWLDEQIDDFDALIVSIDMLVYGGLIPSRISEDKITLLLARLEILRDIKHSHPHTLLFGFSLITRIANHADNIEEPDYWRDSGEQLYHYSQGYDRHIYGSGDAPLIDDVNERDLSDFVQRRLRNHIVNLATLDLLSDDVFDLLVISSDDTSEYGFGTREKHWIREWVDRRGGDERLLMIPGADEVASVLLARAIIEAHHAVPRFYVHYAIEADRDQIAPFEDVPVSTTVQRQVEAVGGVQVDSVDGADLVIAVNPPAPSGKEFYDPNDQEAERLYRQEALTNFAKQIATWLDEGQHILVCDVAYPNGSDPLLVEALRHHLTLTDLSSYGAWNTAGNTIGVALAQGIASNIMEDETAELRFLIHRFIEDYAYMHLIRPTLFQAGHTGLLDEATGETITQQIEDELNEHLATFPDFTGWRIVNVRLPWKRLFEVDFDLEKV